MPGSSVIVALAPIFLHSLLKSFGLIPNVSRLFINVTCDRLSNTSKYRTFHFHILIFTFFFHIKSLLSTFLPPARTTTLISIGSNFPVCSNVFPPRVTSCMCVMRPMNLFIPSSIVTVS